MNSPARTLGPLLVSLVLLLAACSSPPSTTAPTSSGSAATPPPPSDLPGLAADPREPVLAQAAVALLTRQHVLHKAIDDAMSKESFGQYIERLDGPKLLLLETHVTALARYSDKMDDEMREGDLELAHKGGALIATRRMAMAKLVADILAKALDFAAKETLETDVKKRAFCKTEDELRARWRGVLKLQVLERMQQLEDILEAKGKPPAASAKPKDADELKREAAAEKALGVIPPTAEAREEKVRKELAVRYATQFTRMAFVEKLQPAEDFLNSVNAVFDPHTDYLAPAQEANFDIAISGQLEGIGASLAEQDHYVVVHDLVPGGASWQQGKLEIGDLIMSVAQENKEPVEVTDMPIDKVVQMIRGKKGTVVVLTVKKSDGRIENISITRDVIRIEATYARGAILHAPRPPARDARRQEDRYREAVGYVFLPGFYGEVGAAAKATGTRNATDDVRAILGKLQAKKVGSVVLDLRGNGGGLLNHARDITGLFIETGPAVQTRDSDGSIEVLSDKDPSVSFGGQVVVLVDRFSASAAEILAGALQDYERAVVVGTSATHGKGTVQAVIDLDNMRARAGGSGDPLGLYKITVAEYFRISGGSTQLKGVVPDVLLPDPTSFVESGERTLSHAIPWSTIKAAPYAKSPHAWRIPELQSASNARTSGNADFAAVRAFGKILTERRDKTVEPLDRDTWQKAKKAEKAQLEAVDPKNKERKAVLEVESLDAAAASGAQPADAKLQKRLNVWKDDLARDLWVEECARILQDMAKKN